MAEFLRNSAIESGVFSWITGNRSEIADPHPTTSDGGEDQADARMLDGHLP
ncbi:MAG: hypothetical protein M1608_17475 [Candidatus Omnitrophica bacterium]|nr:hypothetical protein [Candidatus Omnitrophota bacterium]